MKRRCLNCMNLFWIPTGHEAEDNVCPVCGHVEHAPQRSVLCLPEETLLGNRYILGTCIECGGRFYIYRTWDTRLNKKCLVKELFQSDLVIRSEAGDVIPATPYHRLAFEDEMKTLREEATYMVPYHDNDLVAGIYDCVETNGTIYVITDWIDGCTLAQYMRRNMITRFSLTQLFSFCKGICNIIIDLHSRGLFCGNITPRVIWVCEDSKYRLEITEDSFYIIERKVLLTQPVYSSPECYRVNCNYNASADIYSLATVLYQVSTGIIPDDCMERLGGDLLKEPKEVNPFLSSAFSHAVMKGLSLDWRVRYQSMQEFTRALWAQERRVSAQDTSLSDKRKISILGDSVSTFSGYNPEGYSVYYNSIMQAKNRLNSVEDTWWAQVIHMLSGELCVNNAYSGSRVSGDDFPSASCEDRLQNLNRDGIAPDIILIYIGYNDWGYGVRLKKKFDSHQDKDSFEYSYDYMLKRLKELYPETKLVCGTLMRTELEDEPGWRFPERYGGEALGDYCNMIRKICKKNKCYLADLNGLGIAYSTLDGSHPTVQGHKTFAEAWISCLWNLGLL